MEVPEYLDLDEIDFSDELAYSVTSLKNIPELSRRSDGQTEERAAPPISWGRGVSSSGGVAEVHSKFRPVKRVSPLKHEAPDPGGPGGLDGATHAGKEDAGPGDVTLRSPDGSARKLRAGRGGMGLGGSDTLLGELEHYDLDMDEILDVPYIKSSQKTCTLPCGTPDRRPASGGGTLDRSRGAGLPPHSALPGGSSSQTQYCVLSPVKWSDLRKSKSMDPDLQQLHCPAAGGAHQDLPPSGLLSCSSSLASFSNAEKLLSARVFPDPPAGGSALLFPRTEGPKVWTPAGAGTRGAAGAGGEVDEETKRNQNIINIVREGQISLLPHLAADNLEQIRDEDGNNLLHVSASHGHADCLQHLTSLMGEDGLNERNVQQLTPAGLGVKNGHLECVRWMMSETEAIAELSCSREHPSLIHYAARHGQEKVLLWLLQFMQEQAISLDEVDQNGNTAVHVAAQCGHLTCLQTLVEYGSNVTILNQQGERPSQSAEHQGHITCARYLVVVETCMSLASQVVKLTKQLNEQAAERMALQKHMQRMLDPSKAEAMPTCSPSSHHPLEEAWPKLVLTAEAVPPDSQWLLRQGSRVPDLVLKQLLGKEEACPRERAPPVGGAGRLPGLMERRDLKLARLKQLMQRSLSESDSDNYPSEEGRGAPRPERPGHLPIAEEEPVSNQPPTAARPLILAPASSALAERKLAFTLGGSKSVDGISTASGPYPTGTEGADGRPAEDAQDQKVAISPKSALKSPSSRRKPSQNLKLRVTFDEQVSRTPGQEAEPAREHHGKDEQARGHHGKDRGGGCGESRRPFGTFRSIMETLSGNTNHSNNNQSGGAVWPPGGAAKASMQPHGSVGRKVNFPSGGAAAGKRKSKNS